MRELGTSSGRKQKILGKSFAKSSSIMQIRRGFCPNGEKIVTIWFHD
jgi:hypothetical protein